MKKKRDISGNSVMYIPIDPVSHLLSDKKGQSDICASYKNSPALCPCC